MATGRPRRRAAAGVGAPHEAHEIYPISDDRCLAQVAGDRAMGGPDVMSGPPP